MRVLRIISHLCRKMSAKRYSLNLKKHVLVVRIILERGLFSIVKKYRAFTILCDVKQNYGIRGGPCGKK